MLGVQDLGLRGPKLWQHCLSLSGRPKTTICLRAPPNVKKRNPYIRKLLFLVFLGGVLKQVVENPEPYTAHCKCANCCGCRSVWPRPGARSARRARSWSRIRTLHGYLPGRTSPNRTSSNPHRFHVALCAFAKCTRILLPMPSQDRAGPAAEQA